MTKTKLLLLTLGLFLILPVSAHAFTTRTGDSIYVSKEETIDGNLYAAGMNVIVDGRVNGDVICAGQSITINGEVGGDVICAGQSIAINGAVNGSARVAGNSININGRIAHNLNSFGSTISLSPDAIVGWEMLLAGATADIRGKVNGDLHGAGGKVIIGGQIGKNLSLKLDNNRKGDQKNLEILDSAVIGGSVNYTSPNQAAISPNAQISGQINHNMPKEKPAKSATDVKGWGILLSIFSSLVIGLVLITFIKEWVLKITDEMKNRPMAAIARGIVILFITPIIAILLLITVIGIPLSLIMIGIWIIAIILSKIFVGIMAGRAFLNRFWKSKASSLLAALVIGVIIVELVFAIPFIGWLFSLVAIWWGLGGIWTSIRQKE